MATTPTTQGVENRFNYAKWLAIAMVMIVTWALIYTVYTTMHHDYIEDHYFGYSAKDYERHFGELQKAQAAFYDEGWALRVDFWPTVGENKLSISLYDASENLVQPKFLWAEVSRPVPNNPGEQKDVIMSWQSSQKSFVSQPFSLEPGGVWVLRVRAETPGKSTLALFEKSWRFNPTGRKYHPYRLQPID